MRILYYDCFAGISGDMNLAAMIGLGVEPEYLRAELSKLGLDQEFELQVSSGSRHGIHGIRVDVATRHGEQHQAHGQDGPPHAHAQVIHTGGPGHVHRRPGHEAHPAAHAQAVHTSGHGHVLPQPGHEAPPASHVHDHAHDHPGHAHGHADGAPGGHHGHAPRRTFADIEALIMGSALDDQVKGTSLAIFRKVAEAEAKVHNKPLGEVHFHEVGAIDSLVDIVGAAVCFHRLKVDAVWSSPVELGGGFVRCAHGLIPVPAPATAEILRGIPTTRGAASHECTTPTGAAILAALVDRFTPAPAMATAETAYGIGHREAEIPNVLRVHLADAEASQTVGTLQEARLLQCNIDDMTAELLGVAMDLLMEKGAMDVHFTPILMKKNRPATCVSLLCAAGEEERFKELLFRHTTTLGVKSFPLDKTVLDIAFETLETPLGPVTMKKAILNGKVLRSKPELEDCRELARRHGLPLADVYAAIGRLIPEGTE